MLYDLTKSIHILSVITWMSGTLIAALALRYPVAAVLPRVQGFDRRVTSPAMILTWVFGILLALQAGWFGAPWLWAKLVFVFILSGLHGAISGRLKRLTWDAGSTPDPVAAPFLPVGITLLVLIVLLVVLKPF